MHRSGFDRSHPDRQSVRAHHRLDVAAEVVALAGVPHVDDLALAADRLLTAAVGVDDLPVQDDVRTSFLLGALQGVGQLGSLGGQHRHRLVPVAVAGGPADPETSGQRGQVLPLAEPDQDEQGLLPATERAAAPPGTASAAPGCQQRGDIGNQFPGNVERGTIGNHVESFGQMVGLVVRTHLPGTPRFFQHCPMRTIYPCRSIRSPTLGEITSMRRCVSELCGDLGVSRKVKYSTRQPSFTKSSRPSTSREKPVSSASCSR